ncbi:hypothetical protein QE372_000712 [Agrobacterium pusense]|uniref:hypothetical protein n=1 Tax=Agrobacterium pusense TaxID=648995 RepID=UPI002855B13A|nr:hypothetical protein [Agrobacterium pusense]MDR6188444.1 hypothetical protein [Agrobacterium pusense]
MTRGFLDDDESFPERAYREERSEEAQIVVSGMIEFCGELQKLDNVLERKSPKQVRRMCSNLIHHTYQCPRPLYGWSCGDDEEEIEMLLAQVCNLLEAIINERGDLRTEVRHQHKCRLRYLVSECKELIKRAEDGYDHLEGQ